MAFTPKSINTASATLKNHLLNGGIIRYDFDKTYVELMDRKHLIRLRTMGNVGDGVREYGAKAFSVDRLTLKEVLNELKREYCLMTQRCEFSGCCQYTTYGVYLAEE